MLCEFQSFLFFTAQITLFALRTCAAVHYPDPLRSRLEHLLVDTDGAFRSGFKDAITPCTNYVSGAQNLGRETSGQWIRVAFHDFVTARVDGQAGGIDASIGFETLRDENKGTAFNDSFGYWRNFMDSKTSMADLVAISVVSVLGNCGGLQVPLRGGRIDATKEGPFGVPEPQGSLEETLAEFGNAGFNAEDAIGLTACGHSIGRVHNGGFPDVVNTSAITPDNQGGGVDFDATRGNFDIDVVQEYLGGYGQRGGPLVTSPNETVRSDLRLYESDGNRTMQKLGQSREIFFDQCKGLFQRMIDTVPNGVALSAAITPLAIKPVNVTFDADESGKTVISGVIRRLSSNMTLPSVATISVANTATIASSTVKPLNGTGSNIWGKTSFYPFSFALPSTMPTKLKAAFDDGSSSEFTLQPDLFYAPSLSFAQVVSVSGRVNDTSATARLKVVAVTTSGAFDAVDAKISVPTAQNNTLGPKLVETTVSLQDEGQQRYTGIATVPVDTKLLRGITVDVVGTRNGTSQTMVSDVYNAVKIDCAELCAEF